MGRSFVSVRQGVNSIADRWARAARTLGGEDRACAEKLAAMAKAHVAESFYAFDDPLEAVLFSVLLSILREQEGEHDVDP